MSAWPSCPDGFEWEQPDALTLRCLTCGSRVQAEIVDLHECEGDQ